PEHAEDLVQLVARLRQLRAARAAPFEVGRDQLLARTEVLVQRALADARFEHHGVDADALDAVRVEQAVGRIEDALVHRRGLRAGVRRAHRLVCLGGAAIRCGPHVAAKRRWLERCSAKPLCTMPAASPVATPTCTAVVYEPSRSYSTPPPKAPTKLPIWWLTNATPPSMACQRSPNTSVIQPATSGPTPSHRKPMMAANTSVPAGVGAVAKYHHSASERRK